MAHAEETKVLDLTSAPSTWAALDAEVADRLGGHSVEVFVDGIPEQHEAGACRVLSALLDEVPHGELDLESSLWTPERLRATQERVRTTGRRWVVALAWDRDGQACGFSEVSLTTPTAVWGQVGSTLVLPGHRGRRLGLALKLATHRRLLEIAPQCEKVATSNAGLNAPMNAVNERMGYRVVERALDVQKSL